jgi:hypothetical protein
LPTPFPAPPSSAQDGDAQNTISAAAHANTALSATSLNAAERDLKTRGFR